MTTDTAATTPETSITVKTVESETGLYCRYSGQSEAQDCYVYLDCKRGVLGAEHSTEIGNAVPVDVWHGHTRRWQIPALKADAANALLEELAPLAARVVDGYDSEWDGSNHVATFDDDAEAAREEIAALCDRAMDAIGDGGNDDVVSVWDAADWYGGIGDRDRQRAALGITAATTDDELDAIETREDNAARENDCDEIEGHARYLRGLRAEATEEATLTLHVRRDGIDGDAVDGYDTLDEARELAQAEEAEVRGYIDGRHVLTVKPDGDYRWIA